MGKVKREHEGHGERTGAEVLSSAEYAAELKYESSGRLVEAGCGGTSDGLEQHVCMGLSACHGFDVDGQAYMAGTGSCATVRHVCHGEGQCRGQGGCGYAGADSEQWRPGDQACRYNGSCASPINISRVFCAGPMKGKSVWMQARRQMEDRMNRASLAYGPAPGEGIPDGMLPEYDIDDEEIPPKPKSASPSDDGSSTAR
ncbi:hypothetical protein [Spirillospora sp. NBC_01491]|uniref:hypothetical protein n=1 Tax=Spirillospora sp. NBC_01491 TaxID=2976007 RepID=UPI002E3533E1|nr:hypothetical protein [Spirillospora sp. NBC_01491]